MNINKCFVVVSLVLVFIGTTFAQSYRMDHHQLVLRTGYTGFADVGSGWTWNVGLINNLDEQVKIGLETDIFYKGDVERSLLGESSYQNGVYENTVEIQDEKHRLILPLYGSISINLGKIRNQPFEFVVGGGAGYQLLFTSHIDYLNNDQIDREVYGGWLWYFKGGARYRISRTTNFISELFYKRSIVSQASDIDTGLPTQDQVDLSGPGIKFGLAINF